MAVDKTALPLIATTTAMMAAGAYAVLRMGKKKTVEALPSCIAREGGLPTEALDLIRNNLSKMSNDALIKLVRQLEFWSTQQELSDDDLVALTTRLVETATWRDDDSFKVPTKRFGRTNLELPVLTCGCMRFQHTWMPDDIPIVASKRTVLESPSQANMVTIVRQCLNVGMNHFETARGYGTSELQLATALSSMMESGEIKRSDFILQTKLPTVETREAFEKNWAKSWKIFEPLGHIDLLSFWVITDNDQVAWALSDSDDGPMAAALEWKQKGFIKHIGFSTHGTASNVMQVIESNKFDYVNLHYHYFGSYHAEGTYDSYGGQGNRKAVERALELDMGVFQISPLDKGGLVYAPSATMAKTIGPKLNPISFVLLHAWKTVGMHTSTIGLARPSDIDEAVEAARIYAKGGFEKELKAAEDRLQEIAVNKLGQEWYDKGLLNLPDLFSEESIKLTHVGHVLWCHGLISAFGMYKFAKKRYTGLYGVKWSDKKTFQENVRGMPRGNPGATYRADVDYSASLAKHYDPKPAQQKLVEAHSWLQKKQTFTDEELKARGWDEAYDLTCWHEFPDTNRASATGVVLQNLTGGLLGSGGGPTKEVAMFADKLRTALG